MSVTALFPRDPQAVDQLVQCLTDDKYKGNMVCVVAGYVHEIDELMEANPGLASRFPDTIHFPNFEVDDCCTMLEAGLKRNFSTELKPESKAALPRLLSPLIQVRYSGSAGYRPQGRIPLPTIYRLSLSRGIASCTHDADRPRWVCACYLSCRLVPILAGHVARCREAWGIG